jgi:hypothetical protein
MSKTWISENGVNWAFRLTVPTGTDWAVAVALAAHADERDNVASPGIDRLALITHLNRRSVQRSLRTLTQIGAITEIRRVGLSSLYNLNMDFSGLRADVAWDHDPMSSEIDAAAKLQVIEREGISQKTSRSVAIPYPNDLREGHAVARSAGPPGKAHGDGIEKPMGEPAKQEGSNRVGLFEQLPASRPARPQTQRRRHPFPTARSSRCARPGIRCPPAP